MRRASNRRPFVPVVSPHDGVHGCGGKRCYPSASVAQRVARTARRALDVPLSAYHCGHCRSWHLGELEVRKTGRPRVDPTTGER
jgi:hypothetical protein